MEMNQFFMGLVLLVSVIHLAARAGDYAGALWGGKPALMTTRERDDWYVFFHCADLLGEAPDAGARSRDNLYQLNRHVQRQQQSKPLPRKRVRL